MDDDLEDLLAGQFYVSTDEDESWRDLTDADIEAIRAMPDPSRDAAR